MSKKIFIDVGGYHGESSIAALDPRFGFDVVYCFEPSKSCYDVIVNAIHNDRLNAVHGGLLDRTTSLPIYQAGSLGGSVYEDAPQTGGSVETCQFQSASEFFETNIAPGDQVWLKLNCEGAECDILLSLLRSGEAAKITETLVDLDAHKIPSAAAKLKELQERLRQAPFSYHYPEEVQYQMVTNFGGVRNWLIVTGAVADGAMPYVKSMMYQFRCIFDPKINGYYKIRLLRFLKLRPQPDVPTKRGSAVGRSNR